MSAIDEKIKKLREQEKQLELEKRKIEFLNHILDSAKKYEHKDFAEVKDAVILVLSEFVEQTIRDIESGGQSQAVASATKPSEVTPIQFTAPKVAKEPDLSVDAKINFALENRHLAGKQVKVANDKNLTIEGEVAGLDAPFVIVRTKTGPVIKVPLEKVSLA